MTLRKQIENVPKGYTAWSIRAGLILHMNTSYDFVKYRGKSKSISVRAFEQRPEREKIIFSMIEKNCDNDYNTILQFMIFYMLSCDANRYIKHPHKKAYLAAGEMIHESVKEKWDLYLSKTYRRSEVFKGDLGVICHYLASTQITRDVKTRRELLSILSSNPEWLFRYIMIEDFDDLAMVESLIVVDKIGKLSDKVMADSDNDDSLIRDCAERINKVGKLFTIDEKKYEKLIMDFVMGE